jgi:hypothetical protein
MQRQRAGGAVPDDDAAAADVKADFEDENKEDEVSMVLDACCHSIQHGMREVMVCERS